RMTQKFATHITHFTPTIPATTGHITAGVREWLSETSTQGRRGPSRLSTRHVQDRVRFGRMLFQLLDSLIGREYEQSDLVPLGFALHSVPHRHGIRPSADDQTMTFPRNLLFDRNPRVPELVAKFLRWLLLTLTRASAVDQPVVLIHHAIDSDGTKGKL